MPARGMIEQFMNLLTILENRFHFEQATALNQLIWIGVLGISLYCITAWCRPRNERRSLELIKAELEGILEQMEDMRVMQDKYKKKSDSYSCHPSPAIPTAAAASRLSSTEESGRTLRQMEDTWVKREKFKKKSNRFKGCVATYHDLCMAILKFPKAA